MEEYRWADNTDTLWADMTPTELFDDIAVDDDTTGETAAGSDTEPMLCRYLVAECVIVGQVRLGTVHSVTGFSWQATLFVGMAAD